MDNDPDLEMILADMRQEFVESSADRLDEVEESTSRLLSKKGKAEYEMLEIKRHVHSIKGMGGSFGFSSVTLWAHALEDYIETVREIGVDQLWDIQIFIDRIRDILEGGVDVDGHAVADAIKHLTLRGVKRDRTVLKEGLSVLLLMPKGIQRKIVGRELTTFGFKVIIAESTLEAIDLGLTHRPDVIISSMLLDRMSGLELASVFSSIAATAHHKCLVITAADEADLTDDVLPENVRIVHKGVNFSHDLIAFLNEQQLLN